MNRFFNRLRDRDEGFTLIEAMVALVIIFGLMVVLLRTFDSGTRVLVETRRQAAASKLASELIERAQALEWQHMGLAVANNGTDCVTEQVGCATFVAGLPGLTAPAPFSFEGEEIVFANADTFAPFLSFHTVENRGGTDFDRYLFVTTIVEPVTGEEIGRRLVALVQWVPPGGFRKEVRLETRVSEFREPSQPLIGSEIVYSGGNFGFNHRDSVLQDGSGVDGTKGWTFSFDPTVVVAPFTIDFTNTPRPAVDGVVLMPILRMDVVSDFVSGTGLQLTSANVAELHWDDIPAGVPLPNTFIRSTDDDASSLPPLNEDPVALFSKSVDGYHYAGPGLRDLVVAELETGSVLSDVSTDPLDKSDIDETDFTAELWTQNVGAIPVEDPLLPNAVFEHDFEGGADEIVVGFTEYESGYFTPSELFYDFRLYRRGIDKEALHLDAKLDRDNDVTTGARTIAGRLAFFGDTLHLFSDDAYPGKGTGKNTSFDGFVRITTPDILIDQVVAGEGVLPVQSLATAGDLVIEVWDPLVGPKGAYVELKRLDYSTVGGCGASEYSETLAINIVDSIRTANHPYLDYSVVGEIEINGWCSSSQTDSLGNVSNAAVQTNGPIVAGDLRYTVTDVWAREYFISNPGIVAGAWAGYAPGEMTIFDIEAHFETDDLKVTTVFVDPNA